MVLTDDDCFMLSAGKNVLPLSGQGHAFLGSEIATGGIPNIYPACIGVIWLYAFIHTVYLQYCYEVFRSHEGGPLEEGTQVTS